MQKIEDGDASFGLFFPANFSDALQDRYENITVANYHLSVFAPHRYVQRCKAILNYFSGGSGSVEFPNQQIVDNSTIYVSVDATGDSCVLCCYSCRLSDWLFLNVSNHVN